MPRLLADEDGDGLLAEEDWLLAEEGGDLVTQRTQDESSGLHKVSIYFSVLNLLDVFNVILLVSKYRV